MPDWKSLETHRLASDVDGADEQKVLPALEVIASSSGVPMQRSQAVVGARSFVERDREDERETRGTEIHDEAAADRGGSAPQKIGVLALPGREAERGVGMVEQRQNAQ